ncbi:GLPGLI family protein [Polaribacter sp. M15]
MRNFLIMLNTFIVFSMTVNSQNNLYGIVHYESKINSEQLKKYLSEERNDIKNKRVQKTLDKVFLNTKALTSKLKFSDNKGIFKVDEKLSIDKKDLQQRALKIASGSTKIYFYDTKNKEYLIKDCASLGDCFIHDNKYFEWNLTQETKKINNYKVYKATRSKGKVIAWYTPDIPVGFGPKGEYGLPGLILELEVGRIIFKATKIVLNPKTKITIERPSDGVRISFEEYKKLTNKAKKGLFGN